MSRVQIRHTREPGFRFPEWAEIIGVTYITKSGGHMIPGRPCFVVRFPDGVEDQWVIYDEHEPYEFREA